jgi:hypothetical protein
MNLNTHDFFSFLLFSSFTFSPAALQRQRAVSRSTSLDSFETSFQHTQIPRHRTWLENAHTNRRACSHAHRRTHTRTHTHTGTAAIPPDGRPLGQPAYPSQSRYSSHDTVGRCTVSPHSTSPHCIASFPTWFPTPPIFPPVPSNLPLLLLSLSHSHSSTPSSCSSAHQLTYRRRRCCYHCHCCCCYCRYRFGLQQTKQTHPTPSVHPSLPPSQIKREPDLIPTLPLPAGFSPSFTACHARLSDALLLACCLLLACYLTIPCLT